VLKRPEAGDGVEASETAKGRHLFVLDSELFPLAVRLFKKAAIRRIRIRSVRLSLSDLRPLAWEPDLFEPGLFGPCFAGMAAAADNANTSAMFPQANTSKKLRLQEAVDLVQTRYGAGAVSRGIVVVAVKNAKCGMWNIVKNVKCVMCNVEWKMIN